MPTAIVDTTTNEFEPNGHAQDARWVAVTLTRNPDPATERFNGNLGAPGILAKSAPELTATVAASTAAKQAAAQKVVDAWPIEVRALCLALIDQLNVIRAALPTPLSAITPAQAIAAVRAKAGTL